MEEGSTPVERGVQTGYGQSRDARNVEMGQRRVQHQALKELSAKMYESAARMRAGSRDQSGNFSAATPEEVEAANNLVDQSNRYNREADEIIPSYRDAQGNVIAAGNLENAKDYYDPTYMRQKVDTNASHAFAAQQAKNFKSPVDIQREKDFQSKKEMLEKPSSPYATYQWNGQNVDPRDLQKDVYKPGFNPNDYAEDKTGNSQANRDAWDNIVTEGEKFLSDPSVQAQGLRETYPDIYENGETFRETVVNAAQRLTSGNVSAEERDQILSGLPNNVRLNILKLEDIQERRKKLQSNPDSAYDSVAIDPNTGEPLYTERDDMQTTYNKAWDTWKQSNPAPVDRGDGNYAREYKLWYDKWHSSASQGIVPQLIQTYGADQVDKATNTAQGWKGGYR